jgi:hypothetical protein
MFVGEKRQKNYTHTLHAQYISADMKKGGAIPPLPNTFSWSGV